MGKIVKSDTVLSALLKYLLPCFVSCAAGLWFLERIAEHFQAWYVARYLNYIGPNYFDAGRFVDMQKIPNNIEIYYLIYYGKFLAMAGWAVFCLFLAVRAFYDRELKRPLDVLKKASDRILDADLDFAVETVCENELGKLCTSFETMRKNLYDSNYALWKSLEERKRVNSAFSHDLRTPITVLKGYLELVEKYDGKISADKQAEIFGKMSVQIDRLERYTEKMSSIHKLEDIVPDVRELRLGRLCEQLSESGKLICGGMKYDFASRSDEEMLLYSDEEIILQVFENLVSNALRYAKSRIGCEVSVREEQLVVTISDDGKGFSEEALRRGWQPFFRGDEEDEEKHFGLGLYICWILCRKCGGSLQLENGENSGGRVTAKFSIKNLKSR